jgi:peptidoglycan-associated lipoprotein
MIQFSRSLKFACVSAVLVLGACTHKQEAVNTAPPPVQSAAPAPAPAPVTSSVVPGSAEDFRVNVGDTIHFGYNEYNVQDNDRAMLGRQAQWLAKYPSVRVSVEGHCDERGTREYNLALGARRANAVKEYLVSQGVSAARVETVSYGKERPVCTESNEACWAQNRRGVTVVTGGANA